MIIAIDGPSGAGKSSVAREVAKCLNFSCLDTGAMYRAVAQKCIQLGVDLNDDSAMGDVARKYEVDFAHEDNNPIPIKVFIDNQDVTRDIRTAEIDKAVTPVSAAPSVREALVVQQRRIGKKSNYVVEGRDIGTVVFSDAELKIFLTATYEERAHRRVLQNEERGCGSVDYDEVLIDLRRRDAADSSRKTSPLRPADDAHHIDSTDMTIDEVVSKICELAGECAAHASEKQKSKTK